MQSLKTNYHTTLATYFASKPLYLDETTQKKPNTRKLIEQPWQELGAAENVEKQFEKNPEIKEHREQLWDNATNTLCNLDFIQAKACAKQTYDLVNDFNKILEVIPDNQEAIREEKARQARMDRYTQDLIRCAKGEITRFELESPKSITPWTQQNIDDEIERLQNSPNRSDFLKDFNNFLGQEAGFLEDYAIVFPYLAIQQAWNYASYGNVSKKAEKLLSEIHHPLLLRSKKTRPLDNTLPQILKILHKHSYSVKVVSITPDGRLAISGSDYKQCILWNLKTGKPLKTLGHSDTVTSVSITPDGKYAVSGSEDNRCFLWDLERGARLKSLIGHKDQVRTVSISPDGRLAFSGSDDKKCIVWDIENEKILKILEGHTSSVRAFSITPDGKQAISISIDDKCIIWDIEKGNILKTFMIHKRLVHSVSILPDGKKAFIAYGDDKCILWDIENVNPIITLKHPVKEDKYIYVDTSFSGEKYSKARIDHLNHMSSLGYTVPDTVILGISTISITPDGKLAVTGSLFGTCFLWDVVSGKILKTLNGHTEKVDCVSITPDGKFAVTGSRDKCILWDLEKGNNVMKSFQHTNEITDIAILPGGKHAITSSMDNKCILWDIGKGDVLKIFDGHNDDVGCVNVDPNGKLAASSSGKKCILWDIEKGEALKKLAGHTDSIYILSFSPDGKRLVSGSADDTCILWNPVESKSLKILKGHSDTILALSFTPDGRYLISGSKDNTCILWDLNKGEALRRFIGHKYGVSSVAVTPDGMCLISGSWDKKCILWDLRSGEVIKIFNAQINAGVFGLSLSPDGRQVFSYYNGIGNICNLWDIKTGELLKSLIGHSDYITSSFIMPDGDFAVSGSNDNRCILWDLKKGEKVAQFNSGSRITKVSFFPHGVFGGTKAGSTFTLELNLSTKQSFKYAATIKTIWDFELQKHLPYSVDCPICGNRFYPLKSVINTIKEIEKKARLKPEQSPCLELPNEAWEHPGLLGECPNCKEKLMFNPFIAGENYKPNPKWMFWQR
jgi:WD40 repeat protein